MIVTDVNVVVYLLTDCQQRRDAMRLFHHDSDWRLPRLWRHEFLNVVVTLTRSRTIDKGQMLPLWRSGLEMFGQREVDPDFERSIELALHHDLSGYDAQYLTLAEELGVPLWTADRSLLRKLPDLCRDLMGLSQV